MAPQPPPFINFSDAFLTLVVGLLCAVSTTVPFLFLTFVISRASSSIESFLDAPINLNSVLSILDYYRKILSRLFEFIIFIPLLPMVVSQSFLTRFRYVIQNLPRLTQAMTRAWTITQSCLDRYAYTVLFELPERSVYAALDTIRKPWKATQYFAELVRSVLLLIGILVTELGKSVWWIGRSLTKVAN